MSLNFNCPLLSLPLQVGDRVVALPEFKAWAELVAVPTKYVYSIPDNMSFSDAAAVAINFVVAHILLFDLAAIRPGKSLLLHSAGGGVVSERSRLCIVIDGWTWWRTQKNCGLSMVEKGENDGLKYSSMCILGIAFRSRPQLLCVIEVGEGGRRRPIP